MPASCAPVWLWSICASWRFYVMGTCAYMMLTATGPLPLPFPARQHFHARRLFSFCGRCEASCAVAHGNFSLLRVVTAARSKPWTARPHLRCDLLSVYSNGIPATLVYLFPYRPQFMATVLYRFLDMFSPYSYSPCVPPRIHFSSIAHLSSPPPSSLSMSRVSCAPLSPCSKCI